MLTIETVKRRFPEVRVTTGKNGPEFVVNCPRPHKKGGIRKLNINAVTGAFVCHDCGFAGSAHDEWFKPIDSQFERLAVRRERDEQEKILLQNISKPRYARRANSELMENGVEAPGKLVLMSDLPFDHVAWNYLSDRKYDVEELAALPPSLALYYCTSGHRTVGGGTNGGRIVFPIYMSGELMGWQARQIEYQSILDGRKIKEVWDGQNWRIYEWVEEKNKYEDEVASVPKYNTLASMSRSSCLYGFDEAKHCKDFVVVVEGPLDKLRVGRQCVGSFGGLSRGQITRLMAVWDNVIIIRDPDVKVESSKFKNILKQFEAVGLYHLQLPDGKDPGDTPRDLIWKSIIDAVPPHIQQLIEKYGEIS